MCVCWSILSSPIVLPRTHTGGNIQPKRDLTRFVRWPKYVRLQRQKQILYQRLKVPPSINQFTQTLERQTGELKTELLHSCSLAIGCFYNQQRLIKIAASYAQMNANDHPENQTPQLACHISKVWFVKHFNLVLHVIKVTS